MFSSHIEEEGEEGEWEEEEGEEEEEEEWKVGKTIFDRVWRQNGRQKTCGGQKMEDGEMVRPSLPIAPPPPPGTLCDRESGAL